MKIAKTTETFDCTAFKVGKTYYLHMHLDNIPFKGLFLCNKINEAENTVTLLLILTLQGQTLYDSLEIIDSDLSFIYEVQPITFHTSWDTGFKEWSIFTRVAEGDDE